MNIRHANVVICEGRLMLHLATGHATLPVPLRLELEPELALDLSGRLEAGVHELQALRGELPLPMAPAALVAAAASKPIAVPGDDLPIS